jgi:hypothetical protein
MRTTPSSSPNFRRKLGLWDGTSYYNLYPNQIFEVWRPKLDYTTANLKDLGDLPQFIDVKSGDYFHSAVYWALDKAITQGTTATTFSPDRDCTNAEILTFLWRAAGSPTPSGKNPFTNVSEDQYYATAARWAYEQGMVSGITFDADALCTRAMTVEYLWKAAGSPSATGSAAFTDVTEDCAEAVAWAVSAGVTEGVGNGLFAPSSVCTRGQIVTFLQRAFGK